MHLQLLRNGDVIINIHISTYLSLCMELGFLSGARWYWPVKMRMEEVVRCTCSDESFRSHFGQPFCLWLCRTEGKYWSYLEMGLVFVLGFFFLLTVGKLMSGSPHPANSHLGCSDCNLGAASSDKIPASALPLLLRGRAAFAGYRRLKTVSFLLPPSGFSAEPVCSSGSPWRCT